MNADPLHLAYDEAVRELEQRRADYNAFINSGIRWQAKAERQRLSGLLVAAHSRVLDAVQALNQQEQTRSAA